MSVPKVRLREAFGTPWLPQRSRLDFTRIRAVGRSIDRAPGDRSEASRYEAAASKLFSLAANVVRFNPRISAARFLFP